MKLVPRTLFGRLLLVFVLFGAVMTGALLYVMRVSHEQFHEEFNQTVNRDLARRYVESNFLLTGQLLNAASLHTGIRKLAAANPEIDIYLLDAAGRIVASSVPDAEIRLQAVSLPAIRNFLHDQPAPIFGDNPRAAGDKVVFSAATFLVEDCPGDYLYLVLGRTEELPGAAQLRADFALREGGGFVLLAFVLSVALSLFVVRLLTRRLGLLEATMSRFRTEAEADPGHGDRSRDGDEIDRLTTLFRDLAEKIEAQMAELKSVDAARREMLANLSHDLRTPITTQMAHLESLQMAGTLTEQERREFIDVAMKQSRRIALLVEQLLEAAKLEAGQVQVRAEPFPIGELVNDVLAKFALVAREREVELRADVTPAETRVFADIALLERVFDNLLGNALRHTPSRGRVEIKVRVQGDVARVSLADTGAGMTAEQVARAFDRFYRGDAGRSTSSGQTGLGLSIVRSILALHGSEIHVETRCGQGTVFTFDLPVYTEMTHA
jgi:two-component system OmpR family sensor kinase